MNANPPRHDRHLVYRPTLSPLDDAFSRPRSEPDSDVLDLRRLMRAVRRQFLVVAAFVAAGIALAITTIVTSQPLYTAYATILLDEERAELLDLVSALPSAVLGDAAIQSEVEILKSHELALRVVDRLDLMERTDALRIEPSPISRVVGGIRSAVAGLMSFGQSAPEPVVDPEAGADDARRRLASSLRNNLSVERVGRSYVLELTYTAPTPELAREITAAYTDAYLRYQLDANASAARSAVAWLGDRVETLRQSSLQATRDLESFRRQHNLVSVGERLLSEQQLSEVMSQLILAEADAARAGSQARRARSMLDAPIASALAGLDTGETAPSTAVEDLKASYIAAERRRKDVVAEFGEDHAEAQRLTRELSQIETLIREELTRRVASAEAGEEAQTSRVAALREGLDKVLLSSSTDEETLSQLNQLERSNATYEKMYQDSLTRLERAVQQQSVPIVAARVITEPSMPQDQSSPSKARILAIGIFLGGLLGAGVGTLREFRRDALLDRDDVQRALGLPLLGTLSRQAFRKPSIFSREWFSRRGGKSTSRYHPGNTDLLTLLRSVKFAVDENSPTQGARMVMFVSANSYEGKTALATSFALMLAQHGLKTLLIDANPNDMSAARALGLTPDISLSEILDMDEPVPPAELPGGGQNSRWSVLPLSPAGNPHAGIVRAGTRRMESVIDHYRSLYDYIVVDAAAASEGRDADALAPYVDTAILVNRARHASATATREVAETAKWRSKIIGIVLNKS